MIYTSKIQQKLRFLKNERYAHRRKLICCKWCTKTSENAENGQIHQPVVSHRFLYPPDTLARRYRKLNISETLFWKSHWRHIQCHVRTKNGSRRRWSENFKNLEYSISPSSGRVRKSSAALGRSEIVFLIDWRRFQII